MKFGKPLSRRTVLQGLGAGLSLPLLDAMLPARARAAEQAVATRAAFIFVPNGAHMPDWTPAASGADFTLPPILEPLAPHREKLLVLTGLAQDQARAHGDGPGDHARASAVYLTGTHPVKTDGADIRVGISADQVIALRLGDRTPLPSLELGCDQGAQSGSCDSGYSCAYSSNISWRSETTPTGKEVNPRLVFERLFGGERSGESAESLARRTLYRKSILDLVRDDARRLESRLGGNDRRKLDEYLSAVREIEQRIERAEQTRRVEPPDFERPVGVPRDYADHIRLMGDLMALAFQTDTTRVATFMFSNAGSNRSYGFIDVPEGHHDLSHHGNDTAKQEKISRINRFHMEQFAYLLSRLDATPEADGTLLDHSMLVYGSGIGDGNRHNHDDLPVLLAGRGGGTLATGRHVSFPQQTPLNNLFVSMFQRMGIETDEFGDATGTLDELG